jgi:CubicO group peptidase (beta-lactamase class C family)
MNHTPGGLTWALVSALLVSALLALPTSVHASELDPRDPAVDSLFRHLDGTDRPGAAVLVVRNGRVLHRAGYGMAYLEHGIPITPGSVFDIASVSKQFAGYAVALLVEEGRLSLDDEVRSHIPELPDFGDPITVRHLVHHVSGLRDWPGTLRLAGWDFEDVISFEQILRMAFAQRELNFRPGGEYTYSNTGYNLLAEVVSRVTGTPFPRWMEERVFTPLGMTSTHFHDDHRRVVPRRASSYQVQGDAGFARIVSSLTAYGSSSLFTSIDDLARWIEHLDQPSEEEERAVERLHIRGVLNSGDTIDYAYGVIWSEDRGLATVSHGGSWAGFRTHLLRYPDEGLSVVVLGNRTDLDAAALAREVGGLFLADRMTPEGDEEAAVQVSGVQNQDEPYDPSPEEVREFEGLYRSEELRTEYSLDVRGGRLYAHHFRHGEILLSPVGPDLFNGPGLGEFRFQRDGSGSVTELHITAGIRNRNLRFHRVGG